ncbi:MAG: hypothetical protein IJC74_01050 [Clostridia bacterium]|nr:hypothetical protein [Clostridia bacterium]
MYKYRKILIFTIITAMLVSQAFTVFSSNNSVEKTLFSEEFSSENPEWSIFSNASLVDKNGNNCIKLSGNENIIDLKEKNFENVAISADVSFEEKAANAWAGLVLMKNRSESYRLWFSPAGSGSTVKITKDVNGKELVLGSAAIKDASTDANIKFAVREGNLRAMINGAVVLSVYDANPILSGGAALASKNAVVYFDDVNVETESSYLYENFSDGNFDHNDTDGFSPDFIQSDSDAAWIIEKDSQGNANAVTIGNSDISRVIYPYDKISDNNAFILTVKQSNWSAAKEQSGLRIYSKYQAGNAAYALDFYGNKLEIVKLIPSGDKTLGISGDINVKPAKFHEVAFETLKNSDGTVTLNGYISGKLALTVTDSDKPYIDGYYGFEAKNGARPLVNDINLIAISPERTLSVMYAESRLNKPVEVTVNGEDVALPSAPVMYENEFVVNAGVILEKIGITPVFEENKVTYSKSGITVTAENGTKNATLNGDAILLSNEVNISGTDFTASAADLVEPFGGTVSFNEEERILEITYKEDTVSGDRIYTKDGTVFALGDNGKSFRYLRLDGAEGGYRGTEATPVWKIWYMNDELLEKNKTLDLYDPARNGVKIKQTWHIGEDFITSADATLKASDFNKETGEITLNYEHEKANVVVHINLSKKSATFEAEVTNKSDNPMQRIAVPCDWTMYYSKDNTIIVPIDGTVIEYKNVTSLNWSTTTPFDGFVLNGDDVMSTMYIQDGVESDKPLMLAITHLNGPNTNQQWLNTRNETLVYRYKNETVRSATVKVASHDNLRQWADDYVNDCFPNMRTLEEKIPEDLKEMYPKLYWLGTEYASYPEYTKLVNNLPGHANIHMGTAYHAIEGTNLTYDAFPNYFPPDEKYGTIEDLKNYIANANSLGHIYTPRTSFHYYAKGSDLSRKFGYDEPGMAIQNVDGKPDAVAWGCEGWLYSPSSSDANEFLDYSYDKWVNELGSRALFTNVVTIMNTHLYDFHKEAEHPDLLHDELIEMNYRYGSKIPLYSEGASIYRLPSQAGFNFDADWDPDDVTYEHLVNGQTGEFVGIRHDIFPLVASEYAKFFPHNLAVDVQSSTRAVTHSLMYNVNLKSVIGASAGMSNSKWRWLRGVAALSEYVQPYLFGARLENPEETVADNVKKVVYDGNTVTGNFSSEGYKMANDTVAPNGFDFKSADGKVNAGVYTEYNGHKFDGEVLLITEDTGVSSKIFAPVANEEFEMVALNPGFNAPVVTAHYPDGTTKNLDCTISKNGIVFRYPYFTIDNPDAGILTGVNGGKQEIKSYINIPYVEITEGTEQNTSGIVPVMISAKLDVSNYSKMALLPKTIGGNVRIENYTGETISGIINVSGNFFGKAINETYEVSTDEIVYNIPLSYNIDASSIDNGASLTVTQTGLNAMKIPDTLTISPLVYPDLADLGEISKKYDIAVDWDMSDPSVLTANGIEFKAVGAANPSGIGYEFKPGQYLSFGGEKLKYKDKIYIEMLVKFNDLQDYVADEYIFFKVYNYSANAKLRRSIELRKSNFMDAFRFLITNEETWIDTTVLEVEPKLNHVHHIICEYDGEYSRLTIDGVTSENKFKLNGLVPYEGPFRLGETMNAEVSYIRIGGK